VIHGTSGEIIKGLRYLCLVVFCLALVLETAGCSEEVASSDPPPEQGQPSLPIEQEIFDLINAARADEGLLPLARNSTMDGLALQHSKDMYAAHLLSHDGFHTRANEIRSGLGASQVGENVAVGYSSAKAFVVGWLGSKGHRDNIMNSSYTRTGIGYFDGYATQVFCD